MKKPNYYESVIKPRIELARDKETQKWAKKKGLTKKQLNLAITRALSSFSTFEPGKK